MPAYAGLPQYGGGSFGSDGSVEPQKLFIRYFNGDELFREQWAYGSRAEVKIINDVPHREGYKFLYWTSTPSGAGGPYRPGDTVLVRRDRDFHAQFEPLPAQPSAPANVNENPATGW